MQIKITLLVRSNPGVISKTVMTLARNGFRVIKQKSTDGDEPNQIILDLDVDGNGADLLALKNSLSNLEFVIDLLSFGNTYDTSSTTSLSGAQHKLSPQQVKDKCKQIMTGFFGPDAAKAVDLLNEDECVSKCRTKVKGLIGADSAKVFDQF